MSGQPPALLAILPVRLSVFSAYVHQDGSRAVLACGVSLAGLRVCMRLYLLEDREIGCCVCRGIEAFRYAILFLLQWAVDVARSMRVRRCCTQSSTMHVLASGPLSLAWYSDLAGRPVHVWAAVTFCEQSACSVALQYHVHESEVVQV